MVRLIPRVVLLVALLAMLVMSSVSAFATSGGCQCFSIKPHTEWEGAPSTKKLRNVLILGVREFAFDRTRPEVCARTIQVHPVSLQAPRGPAALVKGGGEGHFGAKALAGAHQDFETSIGCTSVRPIWFSEPTLSHFHSRITSNSEIIHLAGKSGLK